MSDREKGKSNQDERKSGGVLEILELFWRFLRLLWKMLDVIAGALPRRSAARRVAAHLPDGGRSADKDEESESQVEWRERWGTVFIVCTFCAAIVGGVGFVVAYWMGANTQWMGGALGLFFLGTGVTLVLWSHWLMRHKQAIGRREVLPSSELEREEFAEAFCGGSREVRRRRLLKWMGFAAMGTLAAIVLSTLRSFGISPNSTLFGTVWKNRQRLVTSDGKPVVVTSLEPGSSVTVFPEDKIGDERAQTVLIRVQEQKLQLPAERASWAPSGYVAYSRVCTHAGCPVAEFEAENSILLCPCHQSSFDVLRAAAPTGGPAARPLPQLPLYADAEGTLHAGGGFSEPPGPGFWGMP